MKKNLSLIAYVLVVCIFATLLISGCSANPGDAVISTYTGSDGLDYFSDESSVLQYLKNAARENGVYYSSGIWSRSLFSGKNADTAVVDVLPEQEISETNLQQEGIDEGDILKTDGDFIYIIRNGKLVCVDIRGKEPEVASETALTGTMAQAYIKGDRAVIVSYDYRNEDSVAKEFVYSVLLGGRFYSRAFTTVSIFDISDRYNVKSVRTYEIEGAEIGTRESDGKIYLVTNKYLGIYRTFIYDRVAPYVCDSLFGEREIAATEIAKSTTQAPETNIMTISVIDWANDAAEVDIMNILGGGSSIYMTKDNLYIFQNIYEPGEHFKKDSQGRDVASYYPKWSTNVAKYDISDGVRYVGNVDVPGFTSSDFAYNEYDGRFRIATTEFTEKNEYTNSVYVYGEDLRLTGKLTGIAPTEKVYGARFEDNTLYLVTFRQVDPLFVIDLSGEDPVITGELKIPGFSTYMHSVGDGLLLGIGRSTQDRIYGESVATETTGVKLSLFDISDAHKPAELDVVDDLGGRDSYSLTDSSYKAFVWSEERKEGYFPIIKYVYKLESGEFVDETEWKDTPESKIDSVVHICRVLSFVRVTINDGKLEVVFVDETQTDDTKFLWWLWDDSARICFVDNELYLYGGNFLKKLDRTTLEKLFMFDFEE